MPMIAGAHTPKQKQVVVFEEANPVSWPGVRTMPFFTACRHCVTRSIRARLPWRHWVWRHTKRTYFIWTCCKRIALGAPGRPPTPLSHVDEILDAGTEIRFDPIRDTIRVRALQLPRRPYVVVSGSNPNHIVTAVVPQ